MALIILGFIHKQSPHPGNHFPLQKQTRIKYLGKRIRQLTESQEALNDGHWMSHFSKCKFTKFQFHRQNILKVLFLKLLLIFSSLKLKLTSLAIRVESAGKRM